MRYIYGPVKSRRLGYSLGISTVPYKVCSFDCVYCQLKRTTRQTLERKRYIPERDILKEFESFFKHKPQDLKIDCVTFSGSGEPTLHKFLGRLIRAIKSMTSVPVVLITNGSTLLDPKVRKDILDVDILIPSLDAVTQDIFEKIDRSVKGLKVKDIMGGGLKSFRKAFGGKIWLEIMLVRGLNDSLRYLKKMKKIIDTIQPDRIQLNSPVRPPAEKWVQPATARTLRMARAIFDNNCDII